jgi:hypothetical protein
MADYFSQFSEAIDPLTKEEANWIGEFLNEEMPEDEKALKAWREARNLSEDDADMDEQFPHFAWSLDKNRTICWLRDDEGFTESHLIGFLQAYLEKFHPDKAISITGAATCSKPRIGEFGGWWLVVTATKVRGGNVWTEAEKEIAKLVKAKGKKTGT